MCFCVHIKIQLFKIVSLTVVYKKIFVLRSTKDTSKLKFGKFRKGVDIPYIFYLLQFQSTVETKSNTPWNTRRPSSVVNRQYVLPCSVCWEKSMRAYLYLARFSNMVRKADGLLLLKIVIKQRHVTKKWLFFQWQIDRFETQPFAFIASASKCRSIVERLFTRA